MAGATIVAVILRMLYLLLLLVLCFFSGVIFFFWCVCCFNSFAHCFNSGCSYLLLLLLPLLVLCGVVVVSGVNSPALFIVATIDAVTRYLLLLPAVAADTYRVYCCRHSWFFYFRRLNIFN